MKTIFLALLASACLVLSVSATESISLKSQPPVVIKTFPEAGSADVAPGLIEIRITFSKQMQAQSFSFTCVNGKNQTVVETPNPKLEADGRTFVTQAKLEPDTTYAFTANTAKYKNFRDTDGNSALPYLVVFKTKAK
jgi:RNA polymerase sigma-70 factor (ECF subfamily)